jgi:Tol biopolymer transport system component
LYWITAATCLVLTLAGAWWWKALGRELLVGPVPFEYSDIKKLTYQGNVKLASISPDGRYLVFVSGTPHHEELDVKPMESTFESTLVPSSDTDYEGLTFSNDSQYILFITRAHEYGSLRKIAITGGDAQVVERNVDGPVALNPNGAELAFRRNTKGKQYVVLTGGKFGTNEVLEPMGSSRIAGHKLAWSPSDFRIAVFLYPSSSRSPMSLELLDAKAQAMVKHIDIQSWRGVSQAAWMATGNDLIVAAEEPGENEDRMQLREVSAITGRTHAITAGPYGYHGACLTRDGRQLVTTRLDRQTRFWLGARSGLQTGRANWTDSGQYDSVGWTDDGRLIAQANRGDGTNIWLIDPAQKRPRMLTQGPSVNREPVWISHQRAIAFASERNGLHAIWRLDIDDGKYRLLATAPEYAESPVCTPDGKTVVYTAWELAGPAIWSTPSEPGFAKPKLLLHNARYAVLSPDGRYLAAEELLNPQDSAGWRAAVYKYPDMTFVRAMPQIPTGSALRWSPDGTGLNYIVTDDQGTSNLWYQPLEEATPRRITSFEEDQVFDYAWSPDGNLLVCLRGRTLSDAFELIRKQ